ncbi:ATP-dependent sacrificial sulfur transferase LarE [Maridesulfovibrio sp.]|uniref:ATP-dependent sacrificial sulfur transferase LarE n=1 Tax=Maridesulfovibrio sp. TaxID=2795000 RepID=UPI002A18A5D2|nr:ATP-dependent sacrificial sulfur transferase LarE [Maridesulfovibrio sp.]
MNDLDEKHEKLQTVLARTGGALVAYSAGVDSTLLLHAASRVLGERVMAATVATPYVPQRELDEAERFITASGIKHIVISLPFPEELRLNPPDHCYTCKKLLFGKMIETAQEYGFLHVLDGTNTDDLGDYRPGLKALRELEIISPFVEAGLTKAEIRELSRRAGLPTWNKPSFACLLSRMPVDTPVNDHDLRQVEEAENLLSDLGFPAVRVRHHGEIARIEVPKDRITEFAEANELHGIDAALKKIGYHFVTLDLGGYSMGSLNRK